MSFSAIMAILLPIISSPWFKSIVTLAITASVAILIYFSVKGGFLLKDSYIEELIEKQIESQTGLDIELSPD